MGAVMEMRRAATKATQTLFQGQPFAWYSADCGALFAAHLAALGHDADIARFGHYSTEFGARRALFKHGFTSVIDWANAVRTIEPIPWARAIIGDVVAMRGEAEGSFPGLAVVLGNQTLLGFGDGPEGRCGAFKPLALPLAVWRVRPCR